jgi:hypothetical protein
VIELVPRKQLMRVATLAAAAVLSLAAAGVGSAHHGWLWAEDEQFELTGVIKEARLGNPHGLLDIESQGAVWTVEVGQPWRNQQAGLTDDKLAPGVEVTASGHRASDPERRLMKAERITIAGQEYDLYPDRD